MKNRKIGKFFDIPVEFEKLIVIDSLKETEYIYEKNCSELVDNLSYSEETRNDLKRKLHNFLTANSTIIDHTRILLKNCPEIREEVELKIKNEFADSPLSNFIKNLRNYITHYSLPLTKRPLKLDNKVFKIGGVLFDKETLLEWSGWNKQSKVFINESESELKVGEIITEHYNKMVSFYEWLDNLIQREYKDLSDRYDNYLEEKFNPKNKK
jgi:hypothetical protein